MGNAILPARRERAVIRFAPGLYDKMLASVGRLPPEHYAILAGRLDDPFYVTEFQPMPPLLDERGRGRASGAAVTLNAPFIEYYLNTSLLPFGLYPLGVMHSHPSGCTRLSGGVAGSGQGDVPSMRSQLENAARIGKPWHNYLAPIVTEPGENPIVTGWVIVLDRPDPIPAEIVWEKKAKSAMLTKADATTAGLVEIGAQLAAWQAQIDEAGRDAQMPRVDRAFNASALRRLRELAFEEEFRRLQDKTKSRRKAAQR